MDPLYDQLSRGIDQAELGLEEAVRERLLAYLALLIKWNRAFNLTAVRDPKEMVVKHLLDSLAVLPHLRGGRFVDVGAGAGLPGIPLAIARPELSFTEIDSAGKKVRFMQQAIRELALTNVEAHHTRVETWEPEAPFDGVLSRAFASIADMVKVAGHLCAADGRLLAMKGQAPDEELAALPEGWRVERVEPLVVPGLDAERCLVVITRDQP